MDETYGRLFYSYYYTQYSNNVLDEQLAYSIEYVLRNDTFNIKKYLLELKEKYTRFNSYMYIFESIGNYLVSIHNNLYEDYINNDESAKIALFNIRRRYYCVMNFYERCLDEEINKKLNVEENKVVKPDFSKKNRFGIKRKIYTNNLKKVAR